MECRIGCAPANGCLAARIRRWGTVAHDPRERVTIDLRGLGAAVQLRAAAERTAVAAIARRAISAMLDASAPQAELFSAVAAAAPRVPPDRLPVKVTVRMSATHAVTLATRAHASRRVARRLRRRSARQRATTAAATRPPRCRWCAAQFDRPTGRFVGRPQRVHATAGSRQSGSAGALPRQRHVAEKGRAGPLGCRVAAHVRAEAKARLDRADGWPVDWKEYRDESRPIDRRRSRPVG